MKDLTPLSFHYLVEVLRVISEQNYDLSRPGRGSRGPLHEQARGATPS